METEEKVVVTGGGERVETHWWCSAPPNQFVYFVYVVRCHVPVEDDAWEPWQEYLSVDRGWVRYPEFGMVEAVLVLPGLLVMELSKAGALDTGAIADSIKALCDKIASED